MGQQQILAIDDSPDIHHLAAFLVGHLRLVLWRDHRRRRVLRDGHVASVPGACGDGQGLSQGDFEQVISGFSLDSGENPA